MGAYCIHQTSFWLTEVFCSDAYRNLLARPEERILTRVCMERRVPRFDWFLHSKDYVTFTTPQSHLVEVSATNLKCLGDAVTNKNEDSEAGGRLEPNCAGAPLFSLLMMIRQLREKGTNITHSHPTLLLLDLVEH